MKLKNVSKIIEQILKEEPDTRDSDELLTLKVWAKQEPNIRKKSYSFVEFSQKFLKGKFHSIKSIERARRKIQEHNEELRGKNYKKRQSHQEDVKEEVRELTPKK